MGAKVEDRKIWPKFPPLPPPPYLNLHLSLSLSLSFSFWGAMHNGKTSIDFHPIVEGQAETFRP
jgi:hypothetical protein